MTQPVSLKIDTHRERALIMQEEGFEYKGEGDGNVVARVCAASAPGWQTQATCPASYLSVADWIQALVLAWQSHPLLTELLLHPQRSG